MGNSLVQTLHAVEKLLRDRTGFEGAAQRPDDADLAARLPQTEVTGDELRIGVARALTEFQQARKVTICYQIPKSTDLTPEAVVKSLVRIAAHEYLPSMPARGEWGSDDRLREGLQLVYREFVVGTLDHRHGKFLEGMVAFRARPEDLSRMQKLAVYAQFMLNPDSIPLIASFLASIPSERQAAFLELVSDDLMLVDLSVPRDVAFYRERLAACAATVRPQASPAATSKANGFN